MTRSLLLLATLASGLVAGLFAAFSYAVLPGLRRTDATTFVSTFRQINVAILNPVFGLLFVGGLVLAAAAVVAVRSDPAVRWWVVAGLVLSLLVVAVTAAVNVPLNDRLADGTGSAEQLRTAFEARWTAWNHVRSGLAVGSFAALLVAVLRS